MFKKILSAVTLVLVAFVVFQARDQIFQAVNYLSSANLLVVLLLIPEQLFMYYCLGQMFFSYMSAKRGAKKISSWNLARISFELNFVNHAIPSGGVAGLGYLTWRLHGYGVTPGQTSFMYLLRYAITILVNQAQTIVAVAILFFSASIPDSGWWVIGLALLVCVGIIIAVSVLVVITSSKKRIDWFVEVSTRFLDWVVKTFTFGHKKNPLKRKTIEDFFMDLHKDVLTAKRNKKLLVKPVLWGIVYGFLEFATFWIVGISMGHPELLPPLMIGVALASVVGSVLPTPGGVGGYEGAMILVLSSLGVEVGLATAVTVTTRVIILIGTIVSGYGFYQNAISKIGQEEKAKILGQSDEKKEK